MTERSWIRGVIEGEEADTWERPQTEGWLVIRGGLPERWRHRAVTLSLVPLLPSEQERMLAGGAVSIDLVKEEPLLGLVAAGWKVAAMARELGVSQRTVERRLARLRKQLGVPSTTDLTALLARLGFGVRSD